MGAVVEAGAEVAVVIAGVDEGSAVVIAEDETAVLGVVGAAVAMIEEVAGPD